MMYLFIIILVAVSHITVNNAFEINPRIVKGDSARPAQFSFYVFLEISHAKEGLSRDVVELFYPINGL